MNRPPWARSKPMSWQHVLESRERSEGGGPEENEGEGLSMLDILTHRYALWWQLVPRYLLCCKIITNWQPTTHPPIIFLFYLFVAWIKLDFPKLKKYTERFFLIESFFQKTRHFTDFDMCHFAARSPTPFSHFL